MSGADKSPVEVRAPQGARLLEIVWDDDSTSFHRHEVLRGFCPCAVCQGHEGAIEWVDGEWSGDAVELTDLVETGQYGLRLVWADGHQTGIYSFRFLNDLAPLYEEPAESIRKQRFGRP